MYIGTQVDVFVDLHKKYGSVVRVAPQMLSFNNSQAWKDIYGHRQSKGQIPKDTNFYALDGDPTPSIICK
jgi:hypothetical protein